MSYTDVVQAIADTTQDAQTLEDVISGEPNTQAKSRLGRMIWSLATINHRVDVATNQANQKLTELQDAINAAAAAGAGANGWTTDLVVENGLTQKQINASTYDISLVTNGWTQADYNDGVIDVRKYIKKDMSNVNTGLQAAIDAAAGRELYIPIPLVVTETMYIKKGLKIRGRTRAVQNYTTDSYLLDFTGLATGKNAFEIATQSAVIGFGMESLYIKGAKNGGVALKIGGSLSNSLTDFNIKDVVIYNFSTGIEKQFSWDGRYENVRIQSCTNGIIHNNQSNVIIYDQCKVVSIDDIALRFINSEGVQFDACDISNLNRTNGTPISLYQSGVTFNTCYFENVQNATGLMTVGSANEVLGSTAIINNPLKLGKNIIVSSPLAYAEINGQDRDQVSIIGATFSAPIKAKATQRITEKNNKKVFSWNPKQLLTITGYGGVTATTTDYRNYLVLNSTSAARGWNVTPNLVVGATYTMRYAMRKTANTVGLAIRHPSSSLGMTADESGANVTIKTVAFVAASTALNITWQGDIELYGLEIIEGNLAEFDLDPFYQSDFNNTVTVNRSALPSNGTWKSGDTVTKAPTTTNPVTEYAYNGTAWRATKWTTLSVATASLPVLTANDIGVTAYDTTAVAFKRWNGTAWV